MEAQLHDWVHGMKTIDTMLLQHFVSAYYNGIKSIYMDNGVLDRYENAGLLDEDSDWHRNLFSNFRDAQQEHFNLSVDEKEELRDELLAEKAKVKQLFQKVKLLKSLQIVDKTTRWIRKLPETITAADQLAAAALVEIWAGAPAPGGPVGEDATDNQEDSATEAGGSENDAYSEKRCTKHRMLFNECKDKECQEEGQRVWDAYQQQFNGSKNWAKTEAERDKASRGGGVAALLHRMQELNLGSVW